MELPLLPAPKANTKIPRYSHRPSLRSCLFAAAYSSGEHSSYIHSPSCISKRQVRHPKTTCTNHKRKYCGAIQVNHHAHWGRKKPLTQFLAALIAWLSLHPLQCLEPFCWGWCGVERFQINPCASPGNLGSLTPDIKARPVSVIPKSLALSAKQQKHQVQGQSTKTQLGPSCSPVLDPFGPTVQPLLSSQKIEDAVSCFSTRLLSNVVPTRTLVSSQWAADGFPCPSFWPPHFLWILPLLYCTQVSYSSSKVLSVWILNQKQDNSKWMNLYWIHPLWNRIKQTCMWSEQMWQVKWIVNITQK